MIKNKYIALLIGTFGVMSIVPTAHAKPANYNNVFISYYTPKNVQAMVNYAKTQQLGGLIMWEFRGDAAIQSSDSLLNTAITAFNPVAGNPPIVMGYWSNWSVYTNDPATRAIPAPAYAVPGSINSITGQVVENGDFTDKLEAMNVVTYAFLEAQAKTYFDYNTGAIVNNPNKSQLGTLYFNDPWADLLPDDSFCTNNAICWFATRMQNKPDNASAKMGNFIAFSKLAHKNANNPLGPLKKIISIGGYGHDDSFEDAFTYSPDDNNEPYMENFVNSAAQIISTYKLDGIDLDYENPNMDHAKSREFAKLVKKLRAKLGNKVFISITLLANPDYLDGTSANSTQGFAKGTLQQIAEASDRINLMTYDMHGAFDYDGRAGRTGFITNLFRPNASELPAGYDPQFSVDDAVKAVTKLGIAARKINIGIPAYGRALAGIPNTNGGLFQIIPSTGSIPRGDLDSATCNTGLPLGHNACSGSFQYSYIIANMRDKGFTETIRDTIRKDTGEIISNGTTAYAASWSVPEVISHQLEISNTGAGSDLGFQVSIYDANKAHNFGPSDWLNPAADKTYNEQTNPNTSSIESINNLTVHWDTGWGPSGDCPTKFNFTKNMHVMIKVNNSGMTSCDIKPLE